mmetsp:Transcript_19292/g.53791  ORF Transcript_19292/g.53791 Transcript_19292/m.53791 type:complete len:101 (+) Transcript_19292:159-461(+)
MDTERGVLFLSLARRNKLQAVIDPWVTPGALTHIDRVVLASVVGKLLWCRADIPAGQARQVDLCRTRDALVEVFNYATSSASCAPDVLCILTRAAAAELE